MPVPLIMLGPGGVFTTRLDVKGTRLKRRLAAAVLDEEADFHHPTGCGQTWQEAVFAGAEQEQPARTPPCRGRCSVG